MSMFLWIGLAIALTVGAMIVPQKAMTAKAMTVQRDIKESKIFEEAVIAIKNARTDFYSVYKRFPKSISEMVSKGFLGNIYLTSETLKRISIDSDGGVLIESEEDEGIRNISIATQLNSMQYENLKNDSSIDEKISSSNSKIQSIIKTKSGEQNSSDSVINKYVENLNDTTGDDLSLTDIKNSKNLNRTQKREILSNYNIVNSPNEDSDNYISSDDIKEEDLKKDEGILNNTIKAW